MTAPENVKRVLVAISVTALFGAGGWVAVAWSHTGTSSATCTSASFTYSGFTSPSKTVTEAVAVNGTTATTKTFTFTSSPATDTIPLNLAGDLTVQPSASWSMPGEAGSFQGTPTQVSCHSATATTTITQPGTTLVQQGTTVTLPGQTLTVTTPAQTLTVTTTTPGTTATTTVTTPGRTTTVVKVVRPHKAPVVTPHRASLKQQCVALNHKVKGRPTSAQPGRTYVFKNGHCQASATG